MHDITLGPNICSGHENGDQVPHKELINESCLSARDTVFGLPYPCPHCHPLAHIRLTYPSSGICVLVFRIEKDFGDDVLPLHGGFYNASTSFPQTPANFRNILIPATHMLLDIARLRKPAWQTETSVGARFITILYLAETSVISQRWTSGMRTQLSPIRDILGSTNETLSEVIAADRTSAGTNTS